MSRAEFDRLHDIVQAIDGAERAVGGLTYEAFARHVSEERKPAFPEIEWRQIADTGNFIRHVYFKVSSERLWNIYEKELPKLRAAVERMIEEFPPDQR